MLIWLMVVMGMFFGMMMRRRDLCFFEIRVFVFFIKLGFGFIKGCGYVRRFFLYLFFKCVGIVRDREGVLVVVWFGSIVIVFLIVVWIVLLNLLWWMYFYMEIVLILIIKMFMGWILLEKVLERVLYEFSMCGVLEDFVWLFVVIVVFFYM